MIEFIHELADALKAGLIYVKGLRQIEFGVPACAEEIALFNSKFPSWPAYHSDFLVRYNGIHFAPERGRLFSINEIIDTYDSLDPDDTRKLSSYLAIFGINHTNKYWALDLTTGNLPGQEPVLEMNVMYLEAGGILYPDIIRTDIPLAEFKVGPSFLIWLESLLTLFRDQANSELFGQFKPFC